MVRKIEKEKKNYGKKTFLRRRISIDSLIDLIEANQIYGEKAIKAQNGEFEFDGIDDIKSNKQLMVGRPVLKIGNLTVKFGFRKTLLDTGYSSMNDEEELVFNRFLVDLREFKDPLGFLAIFEDVNIFLAIPIALSFIPAVDNFARSVFSNYYLFLSSILLLSLILTGIGRLYFWLTDSVFLKDKEGFMKRNFGRMVGAVLSAVLGAAAAKLMGG